MQAGSVVVDAGVNDGCVSGDLFGTVRPQGPHCDAGAVEYAGGGFVSGAGWFDSPPDALAANVGNAGRATFGFIARPPRRGTAPEGELQFNLHGGLRFHSTGYRALLVSGNLAILEGTAIDDAGGSLAFSFTATAGTTQRLRVRVTDAATGELLYDSGDQPLGGGRITVHQN